MALTLSLEIARRALCGICLLLAPLAQHTRRRPSLELLDLAGALAMASSAAPKAKILACGAVNGQFDEFFKQLGKLQSKFGPFEACLCVGRFFAPLGNDAANAQLQPYLSRERVIPVPVYVLGANDSGDSVIAPDLAESGGDLCSNLTYLGRRGVLALSSGLRVAYLAGEFDREAFHETAASGYARFYCADDLDELVRLGEAPTSAAADVLLVNEWPSAILKGLTHDQLPADPPPDSQAQAFSSPVLGRATLALRPRYLFAGGHTCTFFKRAPYDNGAGHCATRFVGLAAIANKAKATPVFAVELAPAQQSAGTEQRPADCTPAPFALRSSGGPAPSVSSGRAESFFYADQARGAKRVRLSHFEFVERAPRDPDAPVPRSAEWRRRAGLPERPDRGESRVRKRAHSPPPPSGPCWFCLASPDVEQHLVVSVGTDAYVALAKGGLVAEHALVLPIEHHPCSAGLPPPVAAELTAYKDALVRFFASGEREAVVWERHVPTRGAAHLNLQVCPLPRGSTAALRAALDAQALAHGVSFAELAADASLAEAAGATPYFYIELPGGVRLLALLAGSARLPLQFGRMVVAAVLGAPERVDWKSCAAGKEAETATAQAMMAGFAPYEPTPV